jgi:aspartate-semialdehyde dehydrogenase
MVSCVLFRDLCVTSLVVNVLLNVMFEDGKVVHEEKYNVAVVGATGRSGASVIGILAERNFPVAEVVAVASDTSVGKRLSFGEHQLVTRKFSEVDFSDIDIAFFCVNAVFSKKNAIDVANKGCVVIDKTAHFRLNPHVPLVVPEVNGHVLDEDGARLGIISSPNCVAVPLVMTLKALGSIASIKRVVVSTYQSVSGAGKGGVDELYDQTKGLLCCGTPHSRVFPKQIAHNVIPAIGDIYPSGSSDEEERVSSELPKILRTDIHVAATCVRVPVYIGHSMAVACEFASAVSEESAYAAFDAFEGIVVCDRRAEGGTFITPIDVSGEDAVFVSRVRRDISVPHGLLYWLSCDNLRKGAALNSVQIAEQLIRSDPQLLKFKYSEK